MDEGRLAVVERLADFADEHCHSLLELALGWLASNGRIASVISGAMSAGQAVANAAATTGWTLTEDELAEVDRLTAGG